MDRNFIRVVNKIQDAFASVGLPTTIDLPQIVVVGSQSSGKSSVLENIVGRDFLPRGSGIVTRRPLVLQLINRPTGRGSSETVASPSTTPESKTPAPLAGSSDEQNPDEWGEFLHLPGQKFHDFNEIRKEIIRDTDSKTGGNKGISDLPINLRIYSPHVLTLTLVDLPGITKVPVGDQPADIEVQIRDMIMRYISKPNAIILAVSAANTDLANSDALKLALEVDKQCTRTIGVLTKVDLMDANTDVVEILAGRVVYLRLGYVPVINRSQRDIDNKKPIRAAVDQEAKFFQNHPSYSSKARYCGTPFLCQKLNSILKYHIMETLPDIRQRVQKQTMDARNELTALGDGVDESPASQSSTVFNLITEFCNAFNDIISGNAEDIAKNELVGGARISHLFHVLFRNHIDGIDPFDGIKDAEIRTIVHNSSGFQAAMFTGANAFIILLKQQIKRLEDPSIRCVSLAHEEMVRITLPLLQKKEFARFPELRDKLQDAVLAFLRGAVVPTKKLVNDLIAAEMCYINTAHPDLVPGHRAVQIVSERLIPKQGGPIPQGQQPNPNAPQGINQPHAPAVPPRNGAHPTGYQSQLVAPQSSVVVPQQRPDEPTGALGYIQRRITGQPAPGPSKQDSSLDALPLRLHPSGQVEDHERLEIDVVKFRLECYFNIVKRTIKDMVPKSIMLNLVQHAQKNMQAALLVELHKPEVMVSALRESDDVVVRRRELRKLLTALENADIVLRTVTTNTSAGGANTLVDNI